jgi:hypothetical protein
MSFFNTLVSLHRFPIIINTFRSFSKVKQTPGSISSPMTTMQVHHGPVITEQKSSFQAHIAEVHSLDDVQTFHSLVLSDKKVSYFLFPFVC